MNKLNVIEEIKQMKNEHPLKELYKLKEKINNEKFKTRNNKVEIINLTS